MHALMNWSENLNIMFTTAVVAEWLRRWTWNPMGFPRAGSNPADCEFFLFQIFKFWRVETLIIFLIYPDEIVTGCVIEKVA